MKLSMHHTTAYRYARPVVLQPHRMILRPRGSQDIAVLAASLACSPTAEFDWTQDVFGNLIATGTFGEPASELVITSDVTVEQSAAAWPVFRIAPEAHSYSSIPPMISLTLERCGFLLTPTHKES